MFVFRLLKWISGITSGAISILLLVYLGIKNENWAVLTSDGKTVIDKAGGIALIAVWVAAGGLYLLFEFLYKRALKKKKEHTENK